MPILEWVYRAMGVVAPINQRLSRHRLNYIPANLLVMILLGMIAGTCWKSLTTVLKARRAPDAQSLRGLLSGERPAMKYLGLEGELMPEARVDLSRTSSANNIALADYAWAPLADGNGKAILVQFSADRLSETPAGKAVFYGMLRSIPPVIARELARDNYMRGGVRIDRRFMMVEGRQPGSASGPLLFGGVAALLLLALVWSTLARNVIFLPQDGPPSYTTMSVPDPSRDVWVSGTLMFDAATRRFFTHMPAKIGRMETGETAIFSDIERSRTVFGIKSVERSGLWMLGIRPGSMTEVQRGHVFWGTKKFPAVRFHYVSSPAGKPENAVVASAAGDPMALLQGV